LRVDGAGDITQLADELFKSPPEGCAIGDLSCVAGTDYDDLNAQLMGALHTLFHMGAGRGQISFGTCQTYAAGKEAVGGFAGDIVFTKRVPKGSVGLFIRLCQGREIGFDVIITAFCGDFDAVQLFHTDADTIFHACCLPYFLYPYSSRKHIGMQLCPKKYSRTSFKQLTNTLWGYIMYIGYSIPQGGIKRRYTMSEEKSTVGACECCHHKHTPRTDAELKQLKNRLSRMAGQLNGIGKMLDENRYCGDILIQIAAVEKALQGFGYIILKEHMQTCMVEEIQGGNTEIVEEALELVKKLK